MLLHSAHLLARLVFLFLLLLLHLRLGCLLWLEGLLEEVLDCLILYLLWNVLHGLGLIRCLLEGVTGHRLRPPRELVFFRLRRLDRGLNSSLEVYFIGSRDSFRGSRPRISSFRRLRRCWLGNSYFLLLLLGSYRRGSVLLPP